MLTPVLQDVFKDSKVAQNLKLHRKKCTSIINNVIHPVEIKETVEIIKTCPFSVLVDESTDISSHKFLCILVHYVHPKAGTVHTRLLELVAIDATDGSAKKVYEEFKSCLQSKQIPIKNLVGMASDGANMMVGKNNSFFSHLKKDCPNIVLMQCICHSAALVASKAAEKLPRSPEDLIRSVIINFITILLILYLTSIKSILLILSGDYLYIRQCKKNSNFARDPRLFWGTKKKKY